ncbi:MAG: NAD(P)-dependent oxidoreductase, partial [Treponema sp.]|nr:NAD(P)-dependent oxidoreductase [Treponema sp.]
AYDKYVPSSDLATMTSLNEVYASSDYISLHVPLTDETRGMINSSSIATMKKGVRLINTCRGQVVKTDEVAAALKDGRLGGYATDVYEKEPPEGSPLLTAPNALLTPHIGASSEENLLRLGDSIVDRLKKYTKK